MATEKEKFKEKRFLRFLHYQKIGINYENRNT
jgi:hypothetical protein